MLRGKPSPVLPPQGDRVMEEGPPTPLLQHRSPALGERDMAFPRVSSPLPLGVETEREEGGGIVCWARQTRWTSLSPPTYTPSQTLTPHPNLSSTPPNTLGEGGA